MLIRQGIPFLVALVIALAFLGACEALTVTKEAFEVSTYIGSF